MSLSLLIIARGVQIGAAVLLAGIFSFELFVLRRSDYSNSGHLRVTRLLLRLGWWSALAALLSGLLWFGFEVTSMSRLSVAEAFRGTSWRTVLSATRFGHLWGVRLLLLIFCLVLMAIRGRGTDRAQHRFAFLLWLSASVFLISLARISHAAVAAEQPVGLIGDAIHLAAAGVWLGGLPCLAIYLLTMVDSASPRVLRRFSTLSLSCVAVLTVSGLSNAWLLVGSVKALFTTRYGALLLGKLALFGLLVVVGARNRSLVRNFPAETARAALHRLRRGIAEEIALGGAIIAIVGWLGVTAPPRAALLSVPAQRKALPLCEKTGLTRIGLGIEIDRGPNRHHGPALLPAPLSWRGIGGDP